MPRYSRSDLPLAGSYPVATRSGRVTAFQAVPAMLLGRPYALSQRCRAAVPTGGRRSRAYAPRRGWALRDFVALSGDDAGQRPALRCRAAP